MEHQLLSKLYELPSEITKDEALAVIEDKFKLLKNNFHNKNNFFPASPKQDDSSLPATKGFENF